MYVLKNLFSIILNQKIHVVKLGMHYIAAWHKNLQQKAQDSLKYNVLKTWRDV